MMPVRSLPGKALRSWNSSAGYSHVIGNRFHFARYFGNAAGDEKSYKHADKHGSDAEGSAECIGDLPM
jgi:hypothetical protein